MLCCVTDCGREAQYKQQEMCQKHYFRQWRYGTTDLSRTAKLRIKDERGYQFLRAPTHPLLAKGQSYVAEHRIVLYAAIGPGLMCCELCGKQMTWTTCQADHIDENPRNNERSNLRPLCRRCNVWRSMPPAYLCRTGAIAITYEGRTMTPHEWSKDPRVNLSGTQIRIRKRSGMTDEQTLFAPKVTHNGRSCPRNVTKQLKKETE